jgi:hypothetical protein
LGHVVDNEVLRCFKTTIFNSLKIIDNPMNKLSRSGLYKLMCQVCQGSDVGLTGRKLSRHKLRTEVYKTAIGGQKIGNQP